MKTLLPVFFVLLISLQGCENFKDEYELANHKIDSLIYVSDVKDSSLNSFISAFNEIETNLDTIANRQESIEQTGTRPAELQGDQRERINDDIRVINELLGKNRTMISDLQRKVKSQGGKIFELNKLMDGLNKQVAQKDTELVALKFQLDDMKLNLDNLNVTVDTLTAQNLAKAADLKMNIEKLHTAYYVVGTYKELLAKNVVNKEGGFLGIGKNKVLKNDFNSDAFTKIDITQLLNIDLNCKEVKLLTNHPSQSYTLEKDKDNVKAISITDAERFWGTSKYLVIVKN